MSHSKHFNERTDVRAYLMNNEINVRTLCKRANDKGATSQNLSDTSLNASDSILYLYRRMNAGRCKISFIFFKQLFTFFFSNYLFYFFHF